MNRLAICAFEIIVATTIVIVGLYGKHLFFIQNSRSATITLGFIGMLFCMISVGKFISTAPAHPLSILGYVLGSIGLLAFVTQVFEWSLPVLGDASIALIVLGFIIVLKSLIAGLGSDVLI
ncbi:MAG: hypothetical protein ACI35P_07330 [Bacillus sp. (in: firmicutes)]